MASLLFVLFSGTLIKLGKVSVFASVTLQRDHVRKTPLKTLATAKISKANGNSNLAKKKL
jgi:hypothetical protein